MNEHGARLASGMSPWNEIIIVFPSRGFISGSLSFERHVRTVCSRHVASFPSKFHVSCIVIPPPPPPPPSKDRGRRIDEREISGRNWIGNARNERETAGIDQVWAWSKRKVAIENKLGAWDLVSSWLDNCECTDKLRGGCATFNYRTWTPFTIIWAPCIRGWGRPLSDAPRGPRMARSYYIITPIGLDWSISWSA